MRFRALLLKVVSRVAQFLRVFRLRERESGPARRWERSGSSTSPGSA